MREEMKEILIFAGTTEGRRLSERLCAAGISHTICVATGYGEIVLKEHPLAKIHRGRMNREEITEYIHKGSFAAVVDATHPYAEMITENIKAAAGETDIPCYRLKRETADKERTEGTVSYYKSDEECARTLVETEGNILLTTGCKELPVYCGFEEIRSRLYVRVLPGLESIRLCMDQDIKGKQILAMQGPFTEEMNEAMIRQYQIKYLVTKASGRIGGYKEKMDAAENANINVCVIGRHEQDQGYSFDEVCRKLEDICKKSIDQTERMEIVLAGVGMGSKDNLTREVFQKIENADILLGAHRMIERYHPRIEKKSFYKAEEVIPYLKEIQQKLSPEKIRTVILFSGDSGFYSGCQTLYKALREETENGNLSASIKLMPGISSVAYLASVLGESYQDAAVYSTHGKELPNLIRRLKRESKIFMLLSGAKDLAMLGEMLVKADMNGCEISVGYQLSYPEQSIRTLTPKECCGIRKEGLYVCCIKNPYVEQGKLTHGKADTDFIRDKVPMTKEEIREVSICKLKLHKDAVVYDIGSGTGSIAIEIASLSDDIQVFAIERNKEAADLIKKNITKFGTENISVVTAEAPEGFSGLPVPTHAFVGGTGGRWKEILSALYRLNPNMRVVLNAVSMETVSVMKELLSLYSVENEEVIQIQVNRAKRAGQHHLMQAENPVWICSFNFSKFGEEIQHET